MALRLLFALVGWASWVSLATASEPRARLAWERPALSMCPSAETLESDVSALLGHDPFSHDAAIPVDLVLKGRVEERADQVIARIEATSAGGRGLGVRELTAPHGECSALRKPLALIISLFLEAQPAHVEQPAPHARVPVWLGAFAGLRTD